MPRTLPFTQHTNAVTNPRFIVEFGFATPLRLSSKGSYTYDGDVYDAANMQWNPDGRTLTIFDAGSAYASDLRARDEGDKITIRRTFNPSPTVDADWETRVVGEVGRVGITPPNIVVTYHDVPSAQFPYLTAGPKTGLNYIPADGTRIETQNGTVVLRRR